MWRHREKTVTYKSRKEDLEETKPAVPLILDFKPSQP